MAEDRVTIDRATLLDNVADRQVEFSGDASGDCYDFAVQYDVLEALGAHIPNGDAASIAREHIDVIEIAAGRALSRSDGIGRVVVSGNDLDQAGPAGPSRST